MIGSCSHLDKSTETGLPVQQNQFVQFRRGFQRKVNSLVETWQCYVLKCASIHKVRIIYKQLNCLIDRKRTVRGSFRVAPFRIHCLMQNGSEKMFGKLHNTGLLHTQVHVAPLVKCAIAFLSLIRELKQLRSRQLQKTIGLMIKTTDCTCIINASCFLIHFFDVHYTTTA